MIKKGGNGAALQLNMIWNNVGGPGRLNLNSHILRGWGCLLGYSMLIKLARSEIRSKSKASWLCVKYIYNSWYSISSLAWALKCFRLAQWFSKFHQFQRNKYWSLTSYIRGEQTVTSAQNSSIFLYLFPLFFPLKFLFIKMRNGNRRVRHLVVW